MDRVILHSDINACYASVEQLYNPWLRGKAMAVGGDVERRHGIILAKSQEAKLAGVKTGMAIWQARQACPELIVVPPHFERYLACARAVRRIYADYTDRCEPFGLDESWLDITGCLRAGEGARCAGEIRRRVKREVGLTVSVGVSFNKVFAKLGSDYRKPDAVTEISRANWRDMVWPLPVGALLYAGPSTQRRLAAMGVRTIGDLAAIPIETARSAFGAHGELLHDYANGLDGAKVLREDEYPAAKSVGNGVTAPRDLRSMDDAIPVVTALCDKVGARLRRIGARAQVLAVGLRDADSLAWISRRTPLESPTDSTRALICAASAVLGSSHRWPEPLRSLSVRAEALLYSPHEQRGFFPGCEREDALRRLDRAIDSLRERFGPDAVVLGRSHEISGVRDAAPYSALRGLPYGRA